MITRLKTVAICVVSEVGTTGFTNIVAADTKDNAIRAAWLQSQSYRLDFEETRGGSPSYMEHVMNEQGYILQCFELPVHQ